MSDGNEQLREKVSKWVHSAGYPLEYRVAHALTEKGFRVEVSHYLRWPDGQVREIDVIGNTTELQGHGSSDLPVYAAYGIVCECKFAVTKPWLVLHTLPGAAQSRRAIHIVRTHYLNNRVLEAREPLVKRIESSVPVPEYQGYAHRIVEARLAIETTNDKRGGAADNENRDAPYFALRKIATASRLYAAYLHEEPKQTKMLYGIVIPCVIVNGGLFRGEFNPTNGTIDVCSTSFERVLWSGDDTGEQTLIDIIHSDHLGTYAGRLASAGKAFTDGLRSDLSGLGLLRSGLGGAP